MTATKCTKSMLKKLIAGTSQTGFTSFLSNLKVVSAEPGRCIVSMKIGKEHLNLGNSLHGGCSATIVDHVTSLALVTAEGEPNPGVSVSMDLQYLKAAKLDEEILIEAITKRVGRKLAFTQCEIRNTKGDILVMGSHTKYVE